MVVRFNNEEIPNELDNALEKLKKVIKKRIMELENDYL
jgi:hypothetical protein